MEESQQGSTENLNLAGHEALLEFSEPLISQGDTVSGCVIVTIRDDGRPMGRLTVELQEFSREITDDEDEDTLTSRTKVKTRVAVELKEFEERSMVVRGSFSFQLVNARAFPFKLKLERNCRTSGEAHGWQMKLRLHNDLGVYPEAAAVKLDVQMGEELQAVLRTWETVLKFKEVRSQRSWNRLTQATRLWLEPPAALQGELDGVALELRQAGGGALKGRVIFDLQEKSVADYLKSLLDKDLVPHDLSLARNQLLTDDGEPNTEGLGETFGGLLKAVLAER